MSLKSKNIDLPNIYGIQTAKLYEIKNFIFDFGGVLIQKTHTIKNLFDIIESDLNIKIPRSENSYYRKLFRQVGSGVLSSRKFIENILDKYHTPHINKNGALPPKQVNIDYYLELWFQLYSKFSRLLPEMEEIVNQLHDAGFKVSLMSNTFDIHARSNELKGFYNMFDDVFLSNKIGLRKPDLEKYKYVIQQLKTKPKKCIFIDDKLQNLIPARQLGIIAIKFKSIEVFKNQLIKLGIKDISTLSREEIKKTYEHYRAKKKEYKKTKNEYKEIRKKYLKSNIGLINLKEELQKKYNLYLIMRREYKKEKEKRNELICKLDITLI